MRPAAPRIAAHRLTTIAIVVALAATACDTGSTSQATQAPPASTMPTVPPSTSAPAPQATPALPRLDDVVVKPWTPATRTEELTLELASGAAPTVQQVVDAYDVSVAAMPGATPTALPPGDGLGGTYVLGLVDAVRDQLTPAQLAVVQESEPPPIGLGEGGADSTVATAVGSGFVQSPGARSDPTAIRYLALMLKAEDDWRAYRPDLTIMRVQMTLAPKNLKKYLMTAHPFRLDGELRCHINVYPTMYGKTQTDDYIKLVFAHELFHCIQYGWMGGPLSSPPWLVEASAEFAAFDLYRSKVDQSSVYRTQWFDQPATPLAARDYDAWPLYEIVRDTGRDPYPVIQAMVTAGYGPTVPGATTGGVKALLAAGGVDDLTLRMNWSAMTLRSSSFGSPFWSMQWPAPGGAGGPTDNTSVYETLGIGEFDVVGVGDYSQPQITMDMNDPIGLVFVHTGDTPMTTHTEGGTVTVPEQSSGRFCFDRDRCACPKGKSSGAMQMVGREMVFSYPAVPKDPGARVQTVEWDPSKYCGDEADPRATVNGDPHLVSFDGLPFDVMATGEFVATRDTTGGFELQTRFVPASHVGASTSAVAVGDGSHRITFTAHDLHAEPALVVRVDGADAGDDRSISVGDMRATASDTRLEWTIGWGDGSKVELWWAQGWFLGVTVPAERASRLVGLLSAPNHDLHDDLRTPDGRVISAQDQTRIDTDLADAWRVEDTTSLFDYEPGESAATFVGPTAAVGVILPSDEAFAECAQAVGDGAASFERDACAYDVTVTGSSTFVFDYHRASQERAAAQTPPLAPMAPNADPPSTTPLASADGSLLVLSGNVYGGSAPASDPTAVRELTGAVTLAAGAVLVASTRDCAPGANSLLRVTGHQSGALTALPLCDALRTNAASAGPEDEVVNGEAYVWVPTGGQYDISVTTDVAVPARTTISLFADATPTIVTSVQLVSDGYSGSLSGIGDAVVLLADIGTESKSWTATGLTDLCTTTAYGGGPMGSGNPTAIGFCGHADAVAIGPTSGQVVPVVVFSRTKATTQFEFTR
ncbi:MAG: von Willebrand factor type protein [Acidimicrobiales bacterium]|nr:von Willebrand factor type protein [Acidimicrobiales bacterium]